MKSRILSVKVYRKDIKGKLVNDNYMMILVKNKLSSKEFENGVILDGFPRNLNQAIQFQSLFEIDLVINTILDNGVLIKKLLGRRVCGDCGKNYNVCSINEVLYIKVEWLRNGTITSKEGSKQM